ncbi:hypothetical protein QR680_018486 [Steinernema hermaphroditum]|uniref:Uncharacterized protein n=1 Tax=Steinernema hermaphroditum TaxID=289476 RepID=A0AA39LR34_9BILA|nr:hypothetical protein QR680_018486 [Steinernema hermaphroditum]
MTVYPSLPHGDDFHRGTTMNCRPSAPPIELSFNPFGNTHKPSCSFYETDGPQPSCNPDYVSTGHPIFDAPPPPIPPRVISNSKRLPDPICTVDVTPPRVPTPDFGIMPMSNQEINQMDEINLKDENRVGLDESRLQPQRDIQKELETEKRKIKRDNRRAALVESAKRRRAYVQEHKRCCYTFFAITVLLMMCVVAGAVLMFLYSQNVIFQ